jgi:hypothetical protein
MLITKTSDAPCRAPIRLGRAEISRGARTASTALASTKTAFPARSAFNIDMCSAYIRRQRPPPISRLCRRDPASGARSPRRCSRTEELDSRRLRGLFARGREDHAPHADVCNQYDRRAQPPDRPNPAHHVRGRPQAQLHRVAERRLSPPPAARGTGGRAPFEAQPAESSRVREHRLGRQSLAVPLHNDRSPWKR